MREPKWTYKQTMDHLQWRLDDEHRRTESLSDREEFYYCLHYHGKTPEGQRRAMETQQRCEATRVAMVKQTREAAALILSLTEDKILETLRDKTQHHWVKYYITASYRYSRRVLEYIIDEGDPFLRWHVMTHPDIRNADLERLSRDEQCTPFVREEAVRQLECRLSEQQAVC
jgi:hypothetical protein